MKQNSKFEKMKTEFKSLPKKERQAILTKLFLAVVAFFIIANFIVGIMGKSVIELVSHESHSIWYYSLSPALGLWITLFFFGMMCLIVFLMWSRKKMNNKILSTDDRGVSFMKNGVAGTATWMDEADTKKFYEVGNIKNIDATIYGQLSENGKEVVAYKKPVHGGEGDRNIMIIGSPGTGKSFAYVRTELIQSVLRGDSIVCTDPSGELHRTMRAFAEDNGYKVQVLNLVEPSYSDFWNCLEETINHETERLDTSKLNQFVDIYMANANDGGKPDPFWNGAQSNIFKACVGLASWQREYKIIEMYKDLYKKVAVNDPNRDYVIDNEFVNMVSFKYCKKKIYEAARNGGYDEDEVKACIDEIERIAPPFTMAQVFENIMSFNDVGTQLESAPLNHPGRIAYTTYQSSSDTIRQSALFGIQIKMQLFTDERLLNMLSYDGINLGKLNTEKTAIFVAMSDKSNELKPIVSLFFSFAIKDLQDVWDREQNFAEAKGIKNPCRHTTLMLDEFSSIGVIGGNPQSFSVTMSNSRKRHLHINIIIQGISQLDALYGQEVANTIKTCCGVKILLGCGDEATAEYVSKVMAGEATVLNENHQENQHILGEVEASMDGVRVGSTKRMLLTPEEALRWRNKILLRTPYGVTKLNVFPWTDHPCAKMMKTINLYDYYLPIEERVIELEKQTNLPRFNEMRKKLKPIKDAVILNIDQETGELIENVKEEKVEQTSLFKEGELPKENKNNKKSPTKHLSSAKSRRDFKRSEFAKKINSDVSREFDEGSEIV